MFLLMLSSRHCVPMHKWSVQGVWIVQLIAPLFVFMPALIFGNVASITRAVCVCAFIGLQLMINISGNYGNLGLLTIVTCLPFLDDSLLLYADEDCHADLSSLLLIPLHFPFLMVLLLC